MKLFKTLLTILSISLLSSPSWSVTLDDLFYREGLYYEKFTDVPFYGKVVGQYQGSFKNGVKDGDWVWYQENGQSSLKNNYKNGKAEGAYFSYYEDGQLSFKGNYKNGKKEGAFVSYHEDGTVFKPMSGTFKDGLKISD